MEKDLRGRGFEALRNCGMRISDCGLNNQSRERKRPVTIDELRITMHESCRSSVAEQSHFVVRRRPRRCKVQNPNVQSPNSEEAVQLRNADFGLRNGDQEPRFDRLTAGEKALWPNEPTVPQAQGRISKATSVAMIGVCVVPRSRGVLLAPRPPVSLPRRLAPAGKLVVAPPRKRHPKTPWWRDAAVARMKRGGGLCSA